MPDIGVRRLIRVAAAGVPGLPDLDLELGAITALVGPPGSGVGGGVGRGPERVRNDDRLDEGVAVAGGNGTVRRVRLQSATAIVLGSHGIVGVTLHRDEDLRTENATTGS
jgi:hypothetical protein